MVTSQWALRQTITKWAATGEPGSVPAKGILVERYKISGERAFLLLTRVSQTSNRRLHEVANELVQQGSLTGAGAPRPPH